ncbi:hypothetical protein FYK55_24180 [Roseiconus nitratireducens]|uniref:Secreted protein n=1 Tax=Roseiconus nitratireducens TaxID=2605748 RepID=A0A5M6CWU9_9BACT|nr:hypothetical protein [Roseiconus nitratireducens]KAA5539436.1 hypothetical protein FYK55_24180 [Roseiconus nitratireducens]
MKRSLDRRRFALQSSALLGAGSWLAARSSWAEEHDIANKRLVLLGLNALARAADMNYFADGHRGAAMVSAHLLCVDNQLEDAAAARIVELFDLNWASTKLCQTFPEADPDPDAIDKIGAALMDGGQVLREVGHNAIFAMLAIKGFRILPEAATPERVQGICRLIGSFKPWRDVDPASDVDPPPFTDAEAASRYILNEASDAIDRFVGFGQGFAGHMLTFGQSLVEMAAMGDVEWAEGCRTAFRKYVTVTRQGPSPDDRKIADHRPSPLRPVDADYWKRRGDHALGIGHVFKYPYGYYDLMRRANDPSLAEQLDAKAYHVF